jgi:hypothetical protein
MGETSIPCREDTRDRLRDDKTSGVSWDRYLNDLLDAAERADDHANGADVDAIADAVAERVRSPNADDIQTAVESGVENALPERPGR